MEQKFIFKLLYICIEKVTKKAICNSLQNKICFYSDVRYDFLCQTYIKQLSWVVRVRFIFEVYSVQI